MVSLAEEKLCTSLRPLLAVVPVGERLADSDQLREVMTDLEFFLPTVLAEIYPYWRGNALDGVMPAWVKKTAMREIEMLGVCFMISDQQLVALHLRLQLHPMRDEVNWLECRLGERNGDDMVRMPYKSLSQVSRVFHTLERKFEQIDWLYKATYGERIDNDPNSS